MDLRQRMGWLHLCGMFPGWLRWFSALLILAGGAAAATIEKIPPGRKVALLLAADPAMCGQEVGITVFGNHEWTEEIPDFDINAVALEACKPLLNRDVKLVNGRDVGLLLKPETTGWKAVEPNTKEVEQRLAALGREWQVDAIVLIRTGQSNDWMGGTNQAVKGFGHYSRHRNAAYGVFWVRRFDCPTGKFQGGETVKLAQQLPGVEWHDSWKDYPTVERRVVLRGLSAMIKEGMPALLTKAGLTDIAVAPPSLGSWLKHPGGPPPKTFVPEGNELEIPAGVSRSVARLAVATGLKDRGWVLETDADDRMVGVHVDGKKEARCTFTFTDRAIALVPEGYEIQAGGRRVPVAVYRRWQNNLKESIVESLLRAPDETQP